MAQAEPVTVEVREAHGKQAAKHLRQTGKIPGVVYCHGKEATSVQVDSRPFKAVMRRHGLTSLVELEGLPTGKTLAVYREIQLHPVNYEPIHVDFHAVAPDEKIAIEVKIKLVGKPKGVDLHGGVLVKTRDAITIRCIPSDIPEEVEINVVHLDVGDSLHLGEATIDDKYELVSSGAVTLATVTATRESVSKRLAGEGEEGEAAAPAAKKAAPKK